MAMTWNCMNVRIAVTLNRFANHLVNPNVMTSLRCTFLVPPQAACLVEEPAGDVPRALAIVPLLPDLTMARVHRDAAVLPSWLELVRYHDLEAHWV